MMARVRGPIAAATAAGSMFWSGSTSANTGRAPASTMAPAEAMKELGAVMTSSPGPMPAALRPRLRASVPEFRATAWSTPQVRAIASSRAAMAPPPTNSPAPKTSSTRAMTSLRSAANWAAKST